MVPKTVFCPLGAVESDADLDPLLALCSRHEAHLSLLLFAIAPALPLTVDTPAGDDWTSELDLVRKRTRGHNRALQARLNDTGLSFDIRTSLSRAKRIQHLAGVNARVADITVATNSLRGATDIRSPVVFGALFESARPLLVEPNIGRTVELSFSPGRVIIAWDGRVQASRAVAQAIDMLAQADEVHIVSVDSGLHDPDEEPASAAHLSDYLSRYGIDTQVTELERNGDTVDQVLNRHAQSIQADLIVMGAFGHSRLRQRLFGGTTRRILAHASVPVYLAH